MGTKMKGWEFSKTDEPLKLVEKEFVSPKSGYALVKVQGCGFCHTDVGILHDPGWMNMLGKIPVIIGHEIAGTIVEVNDESGNFKAGDRVAICPCPASDGTSSGFSRDGGYATYTVAPLNSLAHVPDEVDTLQAAAASDAGMTAYHALVSRGGVKKGTKVGLIGIGGLGRVATHIAIGMGAEVYVASRKETAREDALAHGALKAAESITEFKQEGLEVIIDFAGADKTTADAIETVAPGGTVVAVGMSSLNTTVCTGTMITYELSLLASTGGTPADISAVLELIKEGKLRIDVDTMPFDKVPEGLEKLHRGEVNIGRMIMVTEDKDFE